MSELENKDTGSLESAKDKKKREEKKYDYYRNGTLSECVQKEIGWMV